MESDFERYNLLARPFQHGTFEPHEHLLDLDALLSTRFWREPQWKPAGDEKLRFNLRLWTRFIFDGLNFPLERFVGRNWSVTDDRIGRIFCHLDDVLRWIRETADEKYTPEQRADDIVFVLNTLSQRIVLYIQDQHLRLGPIGKHAVRPFQRPY
jgi:hypothetical protein